MGKQKDHDEAVLQLYGMASCRYTAELREDLEWEGRAFEEFDVENDETARKQMTELTGGQRLVPVLVENGSVIQMGVNGRGCYIRASEE